MKPMMVPLHAISQVACGFAAGGGEYNSAGNGEKLRNCHLPAAAVRVSVRPVGFGSEDE